MKKTLLLCFLAVAAVAASEVFMRLMDRSDSAEKVLAQLRAERVALQTLEVNGQTVTAERWLLPPTSSADPLRKVNARLLIVERTVFLFKDDVRPLIGDCSWPKDLPAWDFKPDYVVDLGNARYVSGVSQESPAALHEALAKRAAEQGWERLGGGVWRRGREVLVASARESARGTEAMMIVERSARQ